MIRAVLLSLPLLGGCAVPLTGVASLTLLASPSAVLGAEPMGPPVKVRQCVKQVMGVVTWAEIAPTHETVVSQALQETGADVLLNASISNTQSNYGVYITACTQVEGTPAKFKKVGP